MELEEESLKGFGVRWEKERGFEWWRVSEV